MFPRVTHQCATLINDSKLPSNPVQLACVKPAASVRSEPGSNSHIKCLVRPCLITHKESSWFLLWYLDFISFIVASSNICRLRILSYLFTICYNYWNFQIASQHQRGGLYDTPREMSTTFFQKNLFFVKKNTNHWYSATLKQKIILVNHLFVYDTSANHTNTLDWNQDLIRFSTFFLE